jgi:predicted RNase H-like HicB family nuclease
MKTKTDPIPAAVQAILDRPYHRVISGEPGEGYLGEVLELPGCLTAGETPEEALSNLTEAMTVWVESALEHGDVIPEPTEGRVRVA